MIFRWGQRISFYVQVLTIEFDYVSWAVSGGSLRQHPYMLKFCLFLAGNDMIRQSLGYRMHVKIPSPIITRSDDLEKHYFSCNNLKSMKEKNTLAAQKQTRPKQKPWKQQMNKGLQAQRKKLKKSKRISWKLLEPLRDSTKEVKNVHSHLLCSLGRSWHGLWHSHCYRKQIQIPSPINRKKGSLKTFFSLKTAGRTRKKNKKYSWQHRITLTKAGSKGLENS